MLGAACFVISCAMTILARKAVLGGVRDHIRVPFLVPPSKKR